MPELPIYDPLGRPSCGDRSALYNSGAEDLWYDDIGRPSYGLGSGAYLNTYPVAPLYDHYGAPSCGPGSNTWGAYPASPAEDVTSYASTGESPTWEDRKVTISELTPLQIQAVWTRIYPTSGALVRNVRRQVFWRNEFGTPSSVPAESPLLVHAQVSAVNVDVFAADMGLPPTGWVADIAIEWQERIPVGSGGGVVVQTRIGAQVATASPNGGSLPVYDGLGRPSCGSGSGEYLKESVLYDSAGRPSCGPGSALYSNELPVYDGLGRPSCGTGSGRYLAEQQSIDYLGRPSCGTGSGAYLSYAAGATYSTGVGASQGIPAVAIQTSAIITLPVAANPEHLQMSVCDVDVNNGNTWGIYVSVRYVTFAGAASQVLLVIPTDTPSIYPNGDHGIPALPADCASITEAKAYFEYSGPVGATWQLTFRGDPLPAVTGPNAGTDRACALGPNAGTDRACAASPNGGVDRACNPGPNGGSDAACGGTAPTCVICIPGPNNGNDTSRRTSCVTRRKIELTGLQTGWPRPLRATLPRGYLPYPANNECFLPLLYENGGGALPGLENPIGSAPFTLNVDEIVLCEGTQILSARMRVKMTAPTSSSNLWPGWILQMQRVTQPGPQNRLIGGTPKRQRTAPTVDKEGYANFALDIRTPADLLHLVILGDLATLPGGTQGSIDHIIFEMQYIGGDDCRDCGPNQGVDRPCATVSVTDPTPITSTTAWCGMLPLDGVTELVPVIEVSATAAVNDLMIRFFATVPDSGEELPCDSKAAYEMWNCRKPLATVYIPHLNAGEQLLIDGRSERVTTTAAVYGEDRVFASRSYTGFRFFGLTCGETLVLVDLINQSTVPAGLDVIVQGAARSLNGGV